MCGIAGFITDSATDFRHGVATAILAKHMDERGGHSWGFMTDTRVYHALGSITRGLTITADIPQRLALHTRWGTTGANVLANAHPFTVKGTLGKIVGMHNGIISNHSDLNQRHKRSCAVDSQHIFHSLANGQTLNDLEGYGAIVYSLNGVWYIGRFNEGEMSVALTDSGVFFASTKEALIEALGFAGVAVTRWLNVRNNSVYTVTAAGIKRAYKIKARGTRLRWNDKATNSKYDLSWADDDRLNWSYPIPSERDAPEMPSECELCGEIAELYEDDRQLMCAECYSALHDKLPAGYVDEMDFNAYSFAKR
jgi:asparagine synthetase B (glutamine-hydrolysing)